MGENRGWNPPPNEEERDPHGTGGPPPIDPWVLEPEQNPDGPVRPGSAARGSPPAYPPAEPHPPSGTVPGQPSGPYAPGGIEVPYWPTTDESRPPRGPLWFVNTVPMGLIVGIIWVSIVTYEQFTRWNPVQGLALMALLVLVIGATVAFHRARRFGMGLAFALLATPIVLAGSCFGFFASL